jgi:hypothetical protein
MAASATGVLVGAGAGASGWQALRANSEAAARPLKIKKVLAVLGISHLCLFSGNLVFTNVNCLFWGRKPPYASQKTRFLMEFHKSKDNNFNIA